MTPARSPYASESDLDPSDRAVLEAQEADRGPEPEDLPEDDLLDEDAVAMDVGAHPASETTAHVLGNDDEETIDGLDDLEEAVRQQAEDRALGDGEDFVA